MAEENPLIELAKALARRQARIDAKPPQPSDDDTKATTAVKRAK